MKKVLSDYIKSKENEEDFNRFCNLFLKKEVSPFVKVYDAAGPDGGIDADYTGTYTYTGTYERRCGTWIFQCKFFDPTMDKSRARRNLLSKVIGGKRIKGELTKAHALQCDHYVLMTNTLLTAGNKRKIEDAKKEKGYTFSLTCWDAEDLITMTDEFPYLLNSFRDPHLPVFLSWQDMFQDQIAAKHQLLRYDYETFGREDEIRQFQNFVQDPDKRLLTVYGSGGIGKTKLAIELAKTVEQEHTDYEPLFVQMAGDSFESALADIPPNRNYIFFIDDAHDFIDHLGGIKIILNSPGYSGSKAVLITRKPFKAALEGCFRTALPDEAVKELAICRLSLEKTKEFIRKYTKITDGSLLAGLAQLGRDTPLLAVMVIDLFKKEENLSGLTQDKLVELTFESYLNDIFKKYPESSERRRKLLEWLSGIAPIDIEDTQGRDKLAEILKVESYEVAQYLDNLKIDGLLFQYGSKQRVFPHQLSDYILRKACFLSNGRPSSFHKNLLKEFLPLLPVKVIVNLARVENIMGEKSLLDEHVDSLKTQVREGDNFVRMDILEHIKGISYFRPDDAIDIFNIILDNPKEDVETTNGLRGKSTLTHQLLLKQIAKQTRQTVNTLSGFRKTLKIIRRLLPMEGLEVPRHYSPASILVEITRFQTDKSFAYQMEALEAFETWKEEDKPELMIPLLDALDSLFVLEFTELVNEGSGLRISSHSLKYTSELIQLRAQAIDLVRYCLETSEHSNVRVKAIKCIDGAIHSFQDSSWDGRREADPNALKVEQTLLFEILAQHFPKESDFTVLNVIDECLYRYTNKHTHKSFLKKRATQLLEKFREDENYERYLLYRQLVGKFKDWNPSSEKTQKFVKRYVEKYTPIQLSKLMRECLNLAERGWEYGGVISFFRIIGELHPVYGIDLLDRITTWQIDTAHHASGLLVGLRNFDSIKAREVTQNLLNQESIFAKRIIAKSYQWGNGGIKFDQEDLHILKQLSETPDELLRRYIVESLPNFYSVDANTVLEILVRLSSDESTLVTNGVLLSLACKEFKFLPQKHLGKYKQIMQNYLRLARINPDAEPILHTIFIHDPMWVITFFEERIDLKEKRMKQSKSETIPDIIHKLSEYDPIPYRFSELFKGINWDDKKMVEALKRVRDWMLTLPKGSIASINRRMKAPGLLASMVGGDNSFKLNIKINETMRKLLEEWIDSGDQTLMQDAAYLMQDFYPDDVFYFLAESLLIRSEGNPNVKDNITIAICAEVYSRTHGETAPKLEKRIADLKTLRDKTQSRIVSAFANNLIDRTEREIQEQLRADEEFLEGETW